MTRSVRPQETMDRRVKMHGEAHGRAESRGKSTTNNSVLLSYLVEKSEHEAEWHCHHGFFRLKFPGAGGPF
jgi:hypothetical protein